MNPFKRMLIFETLTYKPTRLESSIVPFGEQVWERQATGQSFKTSDEGEEEMRE